MALKKTQIDQASSWLENHKRIQSELKDSVESCAHWTYEDDGERQNKDAQFPDVKMARCEWCNKQMDTSDLLDQQKKRMKHNETV